MSIVLSYSNPASVQKTYVADVPVAALLERQYMREREPLARQASLLHQRLERFRHRPQFLAWQAALGAQVEVDLTLLVNELVYFAEDMGRVMAESDQRYFHPAALLAWERNMAASHYGWTSDDYARAHATLPKVLELAGRLHAAGVRLLLGTDGTGGGPFYARELLLHKQAGLDAWEVLALATHLNATRLGLGERTGTLAPGFEADIVFLNGNPLEDMGLVREVHSTIVNGQAYGFQQLLDLAAAWKE